jgi:hypothetical protein
MKVDNAMGHCDASRLLAESMAEVRAAARHVSDLLEAAPSAEASSLDAICGELDAIAFRARVLTIETRIESLLRGGQGGRFAQLSAEIGILADRCEEAVTLIRRLRAARAKAGALHLPARWREMGGGGIQSA